MSLDKAIKHKKEKRKRYYGSKAFDRTCRNNGACSYCVSSRTHTNRLREIIAEEKLQDYKDCEIIKENS